MLRKVAISRRAALVGAMLAVSVPAAVLATNAMAAPATPQIIGGHEASENYSFITTVRADGEFHCGASLIGPRWVLTAGHCTLRDRGVELTVRVGSNDRTMGGVEARVSRVVPHPDFSGSEPGDIALLKLDRRVGFQPVKIARNAGEPGMDSRILGWGTTCQSDDDSCPPRSANPVRLRELDTRLAVDRNCANDFDPATELCTASRTAGAQACHGDSGGPQIVGRPGDWRLIGITSRDGNDRPGCVPGTAIWTDVAAYAGWIEQTKAKFPG